MPMAMITVRKLADEEIRELRMSAAKRGVSMEQEARDRLRRPLSEPDRPAAGAEDGRWRLAATRERLLALGVKPEAPVDHKAESDALYDYLDDA
jgi:plasmid stability protein